MPQNTNATNGASTCSTDLLSLSRWFARLVVATVREFQSERQIPTGDELIETGDRRPDVKTVVIDGGTEVAVLVKLLGITNRGTWMTAHHSFRIFKFRLLPRNWACLWTYGSKGRAWGTAEAPARAGADAPPPRPPSPVRHYDGW